MNYDKELNFIMVQMKVAYDSASNIKLNVSQKSMFDLVTDIDKKIEKNISSAINTHYPNDKILGEEYTSSETLSGRTWTIDPIDGTCNMANGLKLFGVQCSLVNDGEIVLAAVYLPHFDEWIYATKNDGCYYNGNRVYVTNEITKNNAIVSFGDYSHKNSLYAEAQHNAIGILYSQIAKIRMFGAACMDFSFVAQGRTHGAVVITKNPWDILPGILLCKEAGAKVTDLNGLPYKSGADGVVVAANEELSDIIIKSLNKNSL